LGRAEWELVLTRLRIATGLIWVSGFVVSAILFLLAAPPGFRLTAKGSLGALLLLGAAVWISFRHIQRLGETLAEQPLGPDLYRPLTRFPQSLSILVFLQAIGLSAAAYLWVKLHLGQSLWFSFITMAIFMVLAALGGVCQYFLAKQSLMKVFKILAGQPGFAGSFSRFTTSLRAHAAVVNPHEGDHLCRE
jgi:hypothetical protein